MIARTIRRARPPSSRVTWGAPDSVIAWLAGFVAVVVAVGFLPDATSSVLSAGVLLIVQDVAVVGWIVGISRRKGVGSVAIDFGLSWSPGSAWVDAARWIPVGMALQLLVVAPLRLLQNVAGVDDTQAVVTVLREGSGFGVLVFACAAGLVAPVAEELLFRGLLLRSLLRRFSAGTAVLVGGLVFGAIHPLTDPSVASLIAMPALVLVGVVCGHQAVRTGRLSRAIAIHVGFNAVTVAAVLAA